MKEGQVVFVFLCCWVAFVVGMAAGSVGEITECSGEPVHWAFPLFVLLIIGGPVLVAYWAGMMTKEVRDE